MTYQKSIGTTTGSHLQVRRAALVLLTLVLACTLSAIAANSDNSSAEIGGDFGGCKWSYDMDTETLTVTKSPTGDGAMMDLYSWDLHPWFNDTISHIVVKEGVTHIGNTSFQDLDDLKDVKLPESVTSIGRSAFAGCYNIQSIAFPFALSEVGTYAFLGTTFYQANGIDVVEPTASNLAGKSFSMVDGKLCMQPQPGPAPGPTPVSEDITAPALCAMFVAFIAIGIICAACLRRF
ncbi:MAG: leucine-rich repeat domain-containing protein [archaeon]|nr:leucine-rich repeat domain-containing protein [archaeon]